MNLYKRELYHHGIKGQKWGVRRYQNPDGSYTEAGMKRYFRSDGTRTIAGQRVYDYRKSDRYKNATPAARRTMDNTHKATMSRFGQKRANRIDYRVHELGENRRDLIKKELQKEQLVSAAVVAGIYFAPSIWGAVKYKINSGREAVYYNNLIMNKYADSLGGLNEVKGGFTPGFKYVDRGKKAMDVVMKMAR